MGFDVLYFPPIHPIGLTRRKGKNNALVAALDDCGSPWAIGGSDGGHTAVHRELGTIEDFRQLVAAARARRHRDRARHRVAMLARSSVRQRASGVVPAASGRHAAVRRESAEEVRGHLSVRLRERGLARPVARGQSDIRLLDRAGRAHLPGRQSAHQAVRAVGMADRRDQAGASGRDLPGRGLHAAEDHAPAGQARLHPVVHLLHLAQQQGGADRVFHRALAIGLARLFPAQRLAQHAGHPAGVSANRRPARVHRARRAGRDARRELRHLRTGVRIAGAPAARTGQRGIPRLGEIRAAAMGPAAAPTAWRRCSHGSTASAASSRRCSRTGDSTSSRPTTIS